MAQIFNASINLSKIDKSKIVTHNAKGEPFKNGNVFLNVQVIINDAPDQYGNVLKIVEQQTQEERESKQPKNYLANGKLVFDSFAKQNEPKEYSQPSTNQKPKDTYAHIGDQNDLPF